MFDRNEHKIKFARHEETLDIPSSYITVGQMNERFEAAIPK
jgi:hypothetical protein